MSRMSTMELQRSGETGVAQDERKPVRALASDDKAMLKAAADLTRDLNVASPAIYWADLIGSVVVGYAALFAAMFVGSTLAAIAAGIVAVLALYRAGSFIHELTHIKPNAVPGFRLVWNLIVGVPLMVPSFMYEGVHNQHHAKRYYGTADDPEYLPLALMKPWTLPVFMIAAALAPIGMLIRFGILAPLSLISPKLRETVVARYLGAPDQPGLSQAAAGGRFSPPVAGDGGRVQRLGDCASRHGRDGRHPAARLPDLPRRRVGRDVPQPGPHAGRASVGE